MLMTRFRTRCFAIFSLALAIAGVQACSGTISSLNDVTNATKCTTVNINGFTVPAGQGFTLSLLSGTTVNLSGTSITFNGNGHKFDGGGPFYWDGQGSNGGITKPRPMMKIKISGTWNNVKVVNSPAQTYSVSNPGPLTMSNLNIDNSQGNLPNKQSGGDPAGHNTDGFDCSTTDLTIKDSVIQNQDDCIAINKGSNIVFTGNTCIGGHGASIGSIQSNAVVSGIVFSNNIIKNNDQAFRIKTVASATNASVSNVTYSGNTGTGLGRFGILIDQSYPETMGTPGSGVKLSNINFIGTPTTVAINSSATRVAVNCGVGSCSGRWDWSSLKASGGYVGFLENSNFFGISGFPA